MAGAFARAYVGSVVFLELSIMWHIFHGILHSIIASQNLQGRAARSMHINSVELVSPKALVLITLVTQPMLQLRPNWSLLRSMDLYNQIFCRFQKCNQKVPPPSLPCSRKKKTSFGLVGQP